MVLIKNAQITQDNWNYLVENKPLQANNNIVNLDYWQTNKEALISSGKPVGLRLGGDENPDNFIADLMHFSLIAIEIPCFTDGRGYSLAKILRETNHFKGEIRAVGDILPDQAQYLNRVGFDALELPNEESANLALKKISEFSVFYQSSFVSTKGTG
ncbi:MAG: DUF934 domain-containing protein [Cycloclasticus sp.]|nr:DUF934 domain-containing protein [Cycloclasticus sp.]